MTPGQGTELARLQAGALRAQGASARDLRGLALALEGSLLTESFSDFAHGAWRVLEPRAELKWGWALDAITEHLEAVSKGQIRRLLMNVPPGCMKSLLTGVMFPAWEWTAPAKRSLRYLGTAHKEGLAVRDSLKCRRLIQSAWYQARWPLRLVSDQNAKTKFENEDTGFREAMPFQSMTGSRGDRVLIDDPLSVDSGNSEADLLSAETTFLESVPTRINDDRSAIIVIMQRLHEKDTSGIILAKDLGYTHLMLPMEFEKERRCVTVTGFRDPRAKDGELLFPERFSATDVTLLKKSLGTYGTAGQLQQRPAPRGGGMFKVKHLQLYPPTRQLPAFEYIIQSYDTAFTEKTTNDPCACTVWGVWHDHKHKPCILLLDAWDEHMNYARLRTRVKKDWRATYGKVASDPARTGRRPDAILVEDKASGIPLIQELRTANVPAQKYNPGKADKVARAERVMPLYEMDVVWVPESGEKDFKGQAAKWARPFVKQLHGFGPAVSAHDDYVDTITQVMIYLKDAGWLDSMGLDDEPTEKEYARRQQPPYD